MVSLFAYHCYLPPVRRDKYDEHPAQNSYHCLPGGFYLYLRVNRFFVGAQDTSLEPVTIQLRWRHQFQFAGYYAAIEKGFYKDEGLQVSLREFEPGKNRFAPVLDGLAHKWNWRQAHKEQVFSLYPLGLTK